MPAVVVAYELPIPPSANSIWRWGKGRMAVSKAYHQWQELAWGAILQQGKTAVPSPFVVRITICGGTGWALRRDLDNVVKPLVDLLRKAGVIRDDSTAHMVAVSVRFAVPSEPGAACCTVEIQHEQAE